MMSNEVGDHAWIARWLDSVTETSMTRRKLTSIEAHGGVAKLVQAAVRRGVHLVHVTDDKGNELVAASKQPFKVLC